MAGRKQDAALRAARGRRLREIRDALGLTQYDIVDRLNTKAAELGLPAEYKYYTVSRNEAGAISFEDAAVWLALDPEKRGWDWLVFGPPRKRTLIPRPTASGSGGKRSA